MPHGPQRSGQITLLETRWRRSLPLWAPPPIPQPWLQQSVVYGVLLKATAAAAPLSCWTVTPGVA